MRRIAHCEYKTMPWKNGLGITAEIDRVPEGDDRVLWRFSQASVTADGPFSNFPGYDRWLAVWQGDSIFLNDRSVSLLDPIRFSGDENIFCKLVGAPIKDVGLIFDRSKVNATMNVVEGIVQLRAPCVHYIFDVGSGDTIKIADATELSVRQSLLVSVWTI